MQACVEVWESDPEAYHYNPVGYMALGAGRPGVRPDRGRTSGRSGSATARADPRRGGRRRAHEGALPRLARAGRDGLPARARRAASRSTWTRCAGSSASASRRASRSTPASRSRASSCASDDVGHRGADEPRADRGRRAARARAGPVGEALLDDARPARRRSTSARPRRRRHATSRCGRTGTSRRARSRSTRSRSRRPTAGRRP